MSFLLRHCKDTNFLLCTQTIRPKNAFFYSFIDIHQNEIPKINTTTSTITYFMIQKVSRNVISLTNRFHQFTSIPQPLPHSTSSSSLSHCSASFFQKKQTFPLNLFHIPIIICIFANNKLHSAVLKASFAANTHRQWKNRII